MSNHIFYINAKLYDIGTRMLMDLVLVLNCGSSSLKFSVLDPISEEVYLHGCVEKLYILKSYVTWFSDYKKNECIIGDYISHTDALKFIVEHILSIYKNLLSSIQYIGHRVVHGGANLKKAILINKYSIQEIKRNIIFAPLHNPIHLLGIQSAMKYFPHLSKKNVAVLDTAFFHTLPEQSYLYAIPYFFYKQYNIKRYGAHGISHYYVMQQASKILNIKLSDLNIISCHLGGGSSVAVIRHGICVDTSMGLTPLEGLVMGTRSGDLDPSIIFFMKNIIKMNLHDIQDILIKKSGILGLTNNLTSDFRYLEERYYYELEAYRTMNIFCHRISKYISSYTTLLDGRLDAIIFTGGIGENATLMRKIVLSKLSILGVHIKNSYNNVIKFKKCGFINKKHTMPVLVIPTNEELVIAQETINVFK